MNNRNAWERFEQTGNIQDYLNYKRSLSATNNAEEMDFDENNNGWPGDMGNQNGRSGPGDYPFDA